jgi:hypothetical protein
MQWTHAAFCGATDEVLMQWAKDMWWRVWVRQAAVNYTGMWKRRFGKEDARETKEVEMKTEEEEGVVEGVRERAEEVKRRLARLNERLVCSG